MVGLGIHGLQRRDRAIFLRAEWAPEKKIAAPTLRAASRPARSAANERGWWAWVFMACSVAIARYSCARSGRRRRRSRRRRSGRPVGRRGARRTSGDGGLGYSWPAASRSRDILARGVGAGEEDRGADAQGGQ